MVVLDGLDEMLKALRSEAIAARAAAVTDKYPLVVTCRDEEYRDVVDQSGMILTHAAVLEIEPVDLDDAAAFLMAPGPSAQERWGPVLDHLRVHSDAPLAQVLTSPLMVSLARTVYAVPALSPPLIPASCSMPPIRPQSNTICSRRSFPLLITIPPPHREHHRLRRSTIIRQNKPAGG